jgi:hypothetical protein
MEEAKASAFIVSFSSSFAVAALSTTPQRKRRRFQRRLAADGDALVQSIDGLLAPCGLIALMTIRPWSGMASHEMLKPLPSLLAQAEPIGVQTVFSPSPITR